jgi:hypothetical protein
MNKLLKRYKDRESTKPMISLKKFHKRRFLISIVAIVTCIAMLILKDIRMLYIILKLTICVILSVDSSSLSKYQLEPADEMVEYHNNLVNNLISNLATIAYCIFMMVSMFQADESISIVFDFPTLVLIFYIFRFLNSGLFLALDYNNEDEYEE